jgi:hypothetical protein
MSKDDIIKIIEKRVDKYIEQKSEHRKSAGCSMHSNCHTCQKFGHYISVLKNLLEEVRNV